MSCPHWHLKFSDGHFVVQCIDCDQKWVGINGAGAHAVELKGQMTYPFRETRHDRYVLSRTDKEKPIKKTDEACPKCGKKGDYRIVRGGPNGGHLVRACGHVDFTTA